MNGPFWLMIPQVSPKIHPRRVKLGNRENSRNIKENNTSLFMFLSFTTTPSRDARPRDFACVREGLGERVNLEIRYFPASASEDGGGNSHEHRQSLFGVSVFFSRPTTRTEVQP